ncbi:hypothetical protein H4R35_007502 [Dimargaris xerosporica]|nr:hypothetical protein H4R35_007502 [Dimargaris xerosporica]
MSYQAWSSKLHTIAATLDVNTIVLPDPAPPLPLDYPNVPLNRTKEHAQTELVTIDGQLLQHFNQFTRQKSVAPVELLMAAFVWAYEQCFHQPKVTMLFESHGRNIPGHSCDVTHTLGWFVGHHYLTLAKERHQLPTDVLAHTQSLLRDLPANGFNLFLAKHLKHFDTPAEKAKFDIWPQVAFSYAARQTAAPALESPRLKRRNDLLSPILNGLLPNSLPCLIILSCSHESDQLTVRLQYHLNQFKITTMQQLGSAIIDAVRLFITQ